MKKENDTARKQPAGLLLPPLRLNRSDAALVAELLVVRLGKADFRLTQFARVPRFALKLCKSLRHGAHQGKNSIVCHDVLRRDADEAFDFLMLFTRAETSHFVTDRQGEAICEVTAQIALASLPGVGGKRGLSLTEIEDRIGAYESLSSPRTDAENPVTLSANIPVVDKAWYHRLKSMRDRLRAQVVLPESEPPGRSEIPPFIWPFLAPPRIPEE